MKSILKVIPFAALTILSAPGNASELNNPQGARVIVVTEASGEQQVYRCDACTSMEQLDSWFRVAMNASAYTGEWWAVNFQNAFVRHYQVDRPKGNLSITDIGVDQDTQNYVNAVRDMSYINFGNTLIVLNAYYDESDNLVLGPWDGNWPVTGSIPSSYSSRMTEADPPSFSIKDANGRVSAYDTIVNVDALKRTQASILDSVNSLKGGITYLPNALYNGTAMLLATLTSSKLKLPSYVLQIMVRFPDGSRRTFVYDGNLNQYTPVPGTAVDSDGNLIPENARMFAGLPPAAINQYRFPSANYNFQNFMYLGNSWGVSMHPTVTVGSTITCAFKPTGIMCGGQ